MTTWWPYARLAAALLGAAAIIAQLIRSVQNAVQNGSHLPPVVVNFFSFFTIDSNLLAVLVLVVAAIWAWTAIFTSEHGGVSLEDIRGTVATEIAANPAPEGIAGVVASILSPTLMLFKVSFANGHLLFVISLFVGFVFSLIMLLLSWSRVLDWYAYMGFLYGTGSERSARRASRHVQLKSADVFWFFFFAAVTVVFASGLLASYLGEAPSMLTPGT